MEDLFNKTEGEEQSKTNPNTFYFKENPAISLCAITWSLNHNTMRVKGKIGKCWVVILIDIESSHNFVDPSIVKNTRRGQIHIKFFGPNCQRG